MKKLNDYINEKLILNNEIKNKNSRQRLKPTTKKELIKIINTKIITNTNKNDVIDFYDVDTSNITDMSKLFFDKKIFKIDISNWDVSNVTDFSEMFADCLDLEYVKLNNWNTESLIKANGMFKNCLSLKNIEGIEDWNINNVTELKYMFYNCESLTLDLSKWDLNNKKNNIKQLNITGYRNNSNIKL